MIQFDSVESLIPNDRAISTRGRCEVFTNSTASRMNSGGYFDGRPNQGSFLWPHARIRCPPKRVKVSRRYAYDGAQRLAATVEGTIVQDYSYDGDGNRIETATRPLGLDAISQTRFLWDPTFDVPQVLAERDAGNTVLRRYTYGDDQLLAVRDSGGEHYYHGDRLNSTLAMTSTSGTGEWKYRYDPYGNERQRTQTGGTATPNDIRYVGERLDAASGLYHLRARQYDAGLGRFTQPDALEAVASQPFIQPYAYANNQPGVLVDPTGLRAAPSNSRPSTAGCSAGLVKTSVTPTVRGEYLSPGAPQACLPPGYGDNRLGRIGTGAILIGLGGLAACLAIEPCASLLASGALAEAERGGRDLIPVADVGVTRVQTLVQMFGDDVVDVGRKVTVPGIGSTDIDIVLTGQRFIEVGGPAKAANLADFGSQLQRLAAYAEQQGGSAFFYYAEGTPQSAITLAEKWLGPGHALPIGMNLP